MGVTDVAAASPDEAQLAQAAAAGDGGAFAELYERYERRAFNLCYRILGSEEDAADSTQEAFVKVLRRLPKLEGRDLAFGSYLFTSARHACYDLIDRRRRAEPSDDIPESSIPVGGGVGGGGIGFDPGNPEDDPERSVLLAAGQDEIRAANGAIPVRQREVLALRELEELSYDEIAEIMDMNRNSVAQLISRARINLRDALRDTALASIVASSSDCERAVALLAAAQDRQPADDRDWLTDHLIVCETCRLSREAMEEAGASYRGWLPIAAAPALFRETVAAAAEATGEDWSDVIARRESNLAAAGGRRRSLFGRRRVELAVVGVLALLLVVVVFAGGADDDTPPPDAVPVADEEPSEDTDPAPPEREPASKPKSEKEGPEPAADEPAERPREERRRRIPPAADTAPALADPAGREPSAPPSRPATGNTPRRSIDRETGQRRGGGRGEGVAGVPQSPEDPTPPSQRPPDPEPPPPPPDPPTDQPSDPTPEPPDPPDDPPSSAPGCRDAAGVPIPCPPRRPPERIRVPGQPPG
jgi:RNA polymerase sigma factor (sigma-70 family)